MDRVGKGRAQDMVGGYLRADICGGRQVSLEGVCVCGVRLCTVVWRGVCGHDDSESGFV